MDEEQHQLGYLIDCFPIYFLGVKRVLWLFIGTSISSFSLTFGVIRLIEIWKEIEIHGRAVLLNRLPLPFLLIGFVLPLGIGFIIFAKHHWKDGVEIYDLGFVKHRGKHKKIWLWETTEQFDNRVVYNKFAGNAVAIQVTITLKDQQQNHITLKNLYARMDEVLYQIRQHILPILLSKAHQKLLAGDEIRFHKQVRVSHAGVQIKEQIFPWHELGISIIRNGVLTLTNISNQKVLLKTNVNQVENLDLLLNLIETPPILTD
jgi:hypothetical protein